MNRYKAQLLAKVFQQVHGIDYDDIFSHMEKMDSICLALSIPAARRWEVHHMDVKNSFIHSDLEEEIYVDQPQGYVNNYSLVCRLKESLYGLKQEVRTWMPRWIHIYFLNIFFSANLI